MKLVRADTTHPDFQELIRKLDGELRSRYGVQQSGYEQHNIVDHIQTAIIGYVHGRPVACGCFKAIDSETAELKRMYVDRVYQGRGYGIEVVQALESWAAELGYGSMRLETGKGQPEAIGLYRKCGYQPMENFGPYVGVENSVCMTRQLGAEENHQ